ncbi:hypothetical protein E4099_27505 [Streptomyces palmae]|uniref:Uncharacterized protein n=1 Tax=Streptomyces palmae TaxID=1701085 RepID=A0A4Z0G8D5_9ACTN|nr:hypothetical protein E4099_27505 [Streptomyces palmae]
MGRRPCLLPRSPLVPRGPRRRPLDRRGPRRRRGSGAARGGPAGLGVRRVAQPGHHRPGTGRRGAGRSGAVESRPVGAGAPGALTAWSAVTGAVGLGGRRSGAGVRWVGRMPGAGRLGLRRRVHPPAQRHHAGLRSRGRSAVVRDRHAREERQGALRHQRHHRTGGHRLRGRGRAGDRGAIRGGPLQRHRRTGDRGRPGPRGIRSRGRVLRGRRAGSAGLEWSRVRGGGLRCRVRSGVRRRVRGVRGL